MDTTDNYTPISILELTTLNPATSWFIITLLPRQLPLFLIENGFLNIFALYKAPMTIEHDLWA